jgi:hypothetical protein
MRWAEQIRERDEGELRAELTRQGWYLAQVLPESDAGGWVVSIRQEDTGLLLAAVGPTRLEAMRRAVAAAVAPRRLART